MTLISSKKLTQWDLEDQHRNSESDSERALSGSFGDRDREKNGRQTPLAEGELRRSDSMNHGSSMRLSRFSLELYRSQASKPLYENFWNINFSRSYFDISNQI